MSKNTAWVLESLTAGVINGDLSCLEEARDALCIISDVEDREAMQELTLSILELVKQVLKDQEDY